MKRYWTTFVHIILVIITFIIVGYVFGQGSTSVGVSKISRNLYVNGNPVLSVYGDASFMLGSDGTYQFVTIDGDTLEIILKEKK